MQIPPAPILTPIIKHYLFLDSKGYGPATLRLFSDGNTGMVFTMNNRLSLDNTNTLPMAFLYGQITRFKDILLPDNTSLIIAVFQPAGIKKLLGIPGHELRDGVFRLDEILHKSRIELEEQLAEARTVEEKLHLLNLFFTSMAMKSNSTKEEIVSAAIQYMLKNQGIITHVQLSKLTGYTGRHMERLFMDSIGLNPKHFASIIQLNYFLQQLKCLPACKNLTALACDAGYADQSHLIKAFRKNTGLTPTAYKNNPNKLAINFLALSAC